MEPHISPTISSFVIRFIQEEQAHDAAEHPPASRGTIRHIQSDEEIAFTQWSDAVAFIQRFVLLEPPVVPEDENNKDKEKPKCD